MRQNGYTIIFPSNPLHVYEVDQDYYDEYTVFKGIKGILNFDRMREIHNDTKSCLLNLDNFSSNAIYRGWMLTPAEYKRLYETLKENGVTLINNPEEYNNTHLAINWLGNANINSLETATIDFDRYKIISFMEQCREALKTFHCDKVFIKDYTKSIASTDIEKNEYSIIDVKNIDNAMNTIYKFVNAKGEDLMGGIVLRQYVELNKLYTREVGPIERTVDITVYEEYRVFVKNGEIACVITTFDNYYGEKCRMSSTTEVENFVKNILANTDIISNFFTIDVAITENGTPVVIELGDGQVSGLKGFGAEDFYKSLKV